MAWEATTVAGQATEVNSVGNIIIIWKAPAMTCKAISVASEPEEGPEQKKTILEATMLGETLKHLALYHTENSN